MFTIVRKTPIGEPLLVTDEATTLEIRDDEGELIFFALYMPGRSSVLMSYKEEADFDQNVKNFSLQKKVSPKELQRT